jgi:hypothetical protein
MSAQLVAYLVLSMPLYHSSQTFKFIKASPSQEHDFGLKPQSLLIQLELDSIDILCASIIDKHFNQQNIYESLSLGEFASYYNIKKSKNKNVRSKKIRFINYNKHKSIKN